MTDDHTKRRLETLLYATRPHDDEKTTTPHAPGPPGSHEQLAALERHWGRRLPPSYRKALASYNGMPRLWFDVRLLSTQEIIDDTYEVRPFEGASPEAWKWIFAHGTESRDALAFNPLQVGDDGEMAVIHLSDQGECKRWPSFEAFLGGLLARLRTGIRERGKTVYYLWTNLWAYWPGDSARHSRGFVPGHGHEVHAGQKKLFGQAPDPASQPLLPKGQQEIVDVRFEQAIKTIETVKGALAIVLTDAPSDGTASDYYVYYEPCADLVIALNPIEKHSTIYADHRLWRARGRQSTSLTEKIQQLLEQDRVIDALILSIDEGCELVRLSKKRV